MSERSYDIASADVVLTLTTDEARLPLRLFEVEGSVSAMNLDALRQTVVRQIEHEALGRAMDELRQKPTLTVYVPRPETQTWHAIAGRSATAPAPAPPAAPVTPPVAPVPPLPCPPPATVTHTVTKHVVVRLPGRTVYRTQVKTRTVVKTRTRVIHRTIVKWRTRVVVKHPAFRCPTGMVCYVKGQG